MRKLFAILVIALFNFGCATMLDIGQQACDAVLGGSVAGDLCEQFDHLKTNEEPAETSAE